MPKTPGSSRVGDDIARIGKSTCTGDPARDRDGPGREPPTSATPPVEQKAKKPRKPRSKKLQTQASAEGKSEDA